MASAPGIPAVGQRERLLGLVARLYYQNQVPQNKIGTRPEIKELMGTALDPSSVAKLIKEAHERSVVHFDIDETCAISGTEDIMLGQRLRDEFRLANATVISIKLNGSTDLGIPHSHDGRDDYLHYALGNHAGSKIRDRLDPDDNVAIGPGRAVFQACRLIARGDHPLPRGLWITPLCGRVWTHWWAAGGRTISRPLDADDNALILALALRREPDSYFSQVGYPLFAQSAESAKNIMQEQPFEPGTWRNGPPGRAIVGVGVVDPESGHRFAAVLSEKEPPDMDPYLKKAGPDIKHAVELARAAGLPYFGDVVHRLFPALPVPVKGLTVGSLEGMSKGYDELLAALKPLNDRMVAAEWQHLQAIPSVVAIGGGRQKLGVLLTLLLAGLVLDRSKRLVNELWTDSESATALLELLTTYRELAAEQPELASWYQKMAARVLGVTSE